MTFHVRFSLAALLMGAIIGVSAPAAQASFGVEKFAAVNCSEAFEECAGETFGPFSIPVEPSKGESEEQGYTQAGGHVPWGVTDFKVNTTGSLAGNNEIPVGTLTHIRTDVAPGLATNPTATPQCSMSEFGEHEALPGTGFYSEPLCEEETEIGENKVTVYAAGVGDVPLQGIAYNLVQSTGLGSEWGIALKLPIPLTKAILEKVFAELGNPYGTVLEEELEEDQYYAHTLIEGNVEWGKQANGTNQGDYHDYFEINVSPALPTISSRLVFNGRAGVGDFITNATSCPGHNTTTLHLTDSEGATATKTYTTQVGLSGCNLVPFEPSFSLSPGAAGPDEPDGFSAEAALAHHLGEEEIDGSQLKKGEITLPEGMTLNPSAAAGLTYCTPAQARIHSRVEGMACPKESKLGTVSLNVPTLPPGSLSGKMYLGGPESGSITGPPYIVYVDAESARYGVSVRLMGEVVPNEPTGRLTATFAEPPEQPFSSLKVHFKEGALAPVANSLTCGSESAETVFTPFTETASRTIASAFTVTGCASSSPAFAPTQSTQDQTATAGAHTSFSFSLERPEGQQYLSTVKTTLPPGLVGAIPAATQCPEPQAAEGSCPTSSQIGTANVSAGSGPTPYSFSGPVYLTGPYNGAPFGLSIAVPALARVFNLGTVVTRATINVDPSTAQVTIASTLPRIVKGIPLRVRRIGVTIDRQGFLSNPTACSTPATESTVGGFVPGSAETASVVLKSPFQTEACGALAFKPTFASTTSGAFSKNNGASIETTITQPAGQSNIRSVVVQLPKQLPSRLTTLQKACNEATFAANPYNCPEGSRVGTVKAETPLLPSKLTGPAYLVNHGGAAFPDLDIVLEANGVRIILVGNTNIVNGITTTTFATTPDVAVTSINVNLPIGPHSALAAYGNLCAIPLTMPTTMTAENGAQFKQNTKIMPVGCGVQVIGHKVIGNTAFLTIKTFHPGRISGSGRGLATAYRNLAAASGATTLKVPLSRGGRSRRRPFSTNIRVGFYAKTGGGHSSMTVTVRFG